MVVVCIIIIICGCGVKTERDLVMRQESCQAGPRVEPRVEPWAGLLLSSFFFDSSSSPTWLYDILLPICRVHGALNTHLQNWL